VTASPSQPASTDDPAVPVDRELRRERFGWYSYDWAMSVFNTSVTTVFLGPYLTAVAEDGVGPDGRLPFLGLGIPPGSWFSYVLSASVLLQVLVLPLTGAVADSLRPGDRVWFRHAKAGELCEHVNELQIVDGDTATPAPTYRGEGHAFLG